MQNAAVLSFIYFWLTILYPAASALDMCGQFTYHHMPANDDLILSDALKLQVTATRAECFSNCFHHRFCNRFLHNDQTGECHLHSTEGSPVSSAPGFKYYAADCMISKVSTLPQCPLHFAPFGGFSASTSTCYDGQNWVDDGNSDLTCLQIEWYNTYETAFDLPTVITPGFVVDIRGKRGTNKDLFCALRQPDAYEETTLLRMPPSGDPFIAQYSGGSWLSIVDINPNPIPPGATFELRATFNVTHFQVSLNGNPVATDELLNQVSTSTFLQMFDWGLIEHVIFTYPQ